MKDRFLAACWEKSYCQVAKNYQIFTKQLPFSAHMTACLSYESAFSKNHMHPQRGFFTFAWTLGVGTLGVCLQLQQGHFGIPSTFDINYAKQTVLDRLERFVVCMLRDVYNIVVVEELLNFSLIHCYIHTYDMT
jgi:hypothetical protein